MEMIAMLNGIPSSFESYLTQQARSVVADSAYNANLSSLGALTSNPTLPMRGDWQRGGLQEGLSKSAAASFAGAPTTAMSVSEMVRRNQIASQIYSNRMAGIPESPAAAAAAARAGIIASKQFDPRLAGLGADLEPKDKKDSLFENKAVLVGLGALAGFALAKWMK